jgi:hypothetical protein
MQLCGLQAKRSSGQKGETPAASLYGFMFYAVLYTVFKKVLGFYTVSYRFLSAVKSAVLSRFISVSGNCGIYVF